MTQHQKSAIAVDALDVLFEHRNKLYGAFELRRMYPRNLARALGIAILFVAGIVMLPELLTAVGKVFPTKDPAETTVVLGPPLEMEKLVVPPPALPSTPLPPLRSTRRFVPPVVAADEAVPDEMPTSVVDDLLDKPGDIGVADRDGNPDVPPSDMPYPSVFGTVIDSQPALPNDEPYSPFDVHKMPSFPGGEKEMLLFLAKNIRYPEIARESAIEGTVVLTFVVNKDGSISDVSVLKDIGGGCSKEAMRVVSAMPRWSPGEANGQPVRVRFMLPVRYRLE